MPVPNSFANVTTSIPLSQLDANFNTPITLGNTAIQLGNTVTTLNNMTLANVTISSGNVTITNVSVTTANVTTANITTAIIGTANVTTANVTTGIIGTANVTTGNITTAVITTANVATANITTSQILNYGTANSVVYLNSSKAATANTGLQFDGTNLGLGVTPSAWSGIRAMQIGAAGGHIGALSSSALPDLYIGTNCFYNGSNWIYVASGGYRATRYQQTNLGQHQWFVENNGGTPGNPITFTQAMTLDASGYLGVGTSSPTTTLTIQTAQAVGFQAYKTSAGTISLLGVYDSPTSANCSYTLVGTDTTGSTVGFASGGTFLSCGRNGTGTIRDLIIHNYDAANIRFATNNTERARIDSSGRFMVGMTNFTATAANGIGFGVDPIGYLQIIRNQDPPAFFGRTVSTGNVVSFAYGSTNTNAGVVGSVSVTASNTAYNTSSDYRLKENIQPMTGALAKVAALKPCTYTWKVDGELGEGFIAHELAEVCPQAVNGEKDAVNEDGSIKPQGVDTSFLVATLTAAIQELNAKVEALEAQLKGAA